QNFMESIRGTRHFEISPNFLFFLTGKRLTEGSLFHFVPFHPETSRDQLHQSQLLQEVTILSLSDAFTQQGGSLWLSAGNSDPQRV
ncbi:Anthranilate synthase component 1, partial [Dissostichus eleginoides]